MRADRLLSLMMLLQARGRMTAQELARELEVSERTIYRDIDALSGAGVPIYGERGPEGGYALLDSYRTNLTGLTRAEVRALFMLSIPAPLAELGVSREIRAAMLKLSAALPATRRRDEERARQRIYLDSSWRERPNAPVLHSHLQTALQAVWQDRKLYVKCRFMFGAEVERWVDPYGLVAAENAWHLVCAHDAQMRVYPVSILVETRLSAETFQRPEDFGLVAFWTAWSERVRENRPRYWVKMRVAPDLHPILARHFGSGVRRMIAEGDSPDQQGWSVLTLPFDSFYDARERILGYGGAVEVLDPLSMRRSVLDFAEQIVARYRG